jgi:hypothetical protein
LQKEHFKEHFYAVCRIARESEMQTISSIKPESVLYRFLSPEQRSERVRMLEERMGYIAQAV